MKTESLKHKMSNSTATLRTGLSANQPNNLVDLAANVISNTKPRNKPIKSTGAYQALEDVLSVTKLGEEIVKFAQLNGVTVSALLDKADINQRMFRTAADRHFERCRIDTIALILIQFQEIGLQISQEAVMELVYPHELTCRFCGHYRCVKLRQVKAGRPLYHCPSCNSKFARPDLTLQR